MKTRVTIALLTCALLGAVGFSRAQAQNRSDVLWARATNGQTIQLDGQLDEAVWSQAETVNLEYGENAGIPGSGWFIETGNPNLTDPSDPPSATVRVLANGDTLYVAVEAQDASVGGSRGLWNIDGLLMPLRDKSGFARNGAHWFPAPTREFIYGWWSNKDTTATGAPLPGAEPRMHGFWGVGTNDSNDAQTEDEKQWWQAVTVVNGTANDDTHGADQGYVMEMKIYLGQMGYDLDAPGGDVVETSFAIQDADYFWPVDQNRNITSRAWFQSRWGNTFAHGSVRLHFSPDVTVASGDLPSVAPDFVVPSAAPFDAPTIDGQLDEDVWARLDTAFRLQATDSTMFETLPGVLKYASGWFQPAIAGVSAPVLDPNPAYVKWFFKDDVLYLGVDVSDQSVDSTGNESGDGVRFTINDRAATDQTTHTLIPREFIITVSPSGNARLEGYFRDLINAGNSDAFEAALALKPNTTVADVNDVDEGYQVEIAINLADALGYPVGLGDGALFISAHTFDSDRFPDPALNYNIRAWAFRERGAGSIAWAYMDPETVIGTAVDGAAELPSRIRLLGNYPNPFNPATTLRYALPATGQVRVQLYDVTGRRVAVLDAGVQAAGENQFRFDAGRLASGLYLYRIEVTNPADGAARLSEMGRMMLVK